MNRFTQLLLRILVPASLLAFAPIASAQATSFDKLGGLLQGIIGFIDVYVVPLVFALAFIVFVIGIFRTFIAGATNEEKRQEGQKLVVWGLIGFFLMFSVWGLVNLLLGTFGFSGSTRPGLPTFNPSSGQTTNNGSPSPFGNASNGTCTADSQCPSGETCELISGIGVCSGPHTSGSGGATVPSPSGGGKTGTPTPPGADQPIY